MAALRWHLRALLVGLMLGGCGVGEPLRPSPGELRDLPYHSEHHLFRLAWDVKKVGGDAKVFGVLEVKHVGEVTRVILELRGLDEAGAKVSQRRFLVQPLQPLYPGGTWPFEVRFTPSGRERRYALEVWSYDIGIGGNGKGGGGH